jgi:hypothetical protein
VRLLYHFLGIVAKVNATLFLYRYNWFPLNVIGMFVLLLIGVVLVGSAAEAFRNAPTPRSISLDQLHAQEIVQEFVTITGVYVPVALYQWKKGILESSWAPLVDRKRVLLVEHDGTIPAGKPGVRTVSGMLRPIPEHLRDPLAADKYELEHLPIEATNMLVEGARPAEARCPSLQRQSCSSSSAAWSS